MAAVRAVPTRPRRRDRGRDQRDRIGLLVLGLAWYRTANPAKATAASWTHAVAGGWLVVTPFMLGYSGTAAAVANDVIVGLIVLTLGASAPWQATSRPPLPDPRRTRRLVPPPRRRDRRVVPHLRSAAGLAAQAIALAPAPLDAADDQAVSTFCQVLRAAISTGSHRGATGGA